MEKNIEYKIDNCYDCPFNSLHSKGIAKCSVTDTTAPLTSVLGKVKDNCPLDNGIIIVKREEK